MSFSNQHELSNQGLRQLLPSFEERDQCFLELKFSKSPYFMNAKLICKNAKCKFGYYFKRKPDTMKYVFYEKVNVHTCRKTKNIKHYQQKLITKKTDAEYSAIIEAYYFRGDGSRLKRISPKYIIEDLMRIHHIDVFEGETDTETQKIIKKKIDNIVGKLRKKYNYQKSYQQPRKCYSTTPSISIYSPSSSSSSIISRKDSCQDSQDQADICYQYSTQDYYIDSYFSLNETDDTKEFANFDQVIKL